MDELFAVVKLTAFLFFGGLCFRIGWEIGGDLWHRIKEVCRD